MLAKLNWAEEFELPRRANKSRKKDRKRRISCKIFRDMPHEWDVDEFELDADHVLALMAAGPVAMQVSQARGANRLNGIFRDANILFNGHKMYRHDNGAVMCFQDGWKIKCVEGAIGEYDYYNNLIGGFGPPQGAWHPRQASGVCYVHAHAGELPRRSRAKDKNVCAWQSLQRTFLRRHGEDILTELGEATRFIPVYPKSHVQESFLTASGGALLPAYHGTAKRNISSISTRGLLCPGNGVKVVHGQAHGPGIYTAKLGAARLSLGFCDSDNVFVCAVKNGEDHQPIDGQVLGRQQVHHKSGSVLHVGDAMVVSSEKHVAPLFVAKLVDLDATLPQHWLVPMQRYLNMTTAERSLLRRLQCREDNFDVRTDHWLKYHPESFDSRVYRLGL